MYTYKTEIGDMYSDGHGRWDVVHYQTTLDSGDMQKAMDMVESSLDNSIRDLFGVYDDDMVPADLLDELRDLGWHPVESDISVGDGSYYVHGATGMVQFYLSVMALFTQFEWAITADTTNNFDFPSSGYGLFE